MRLDMEGSIGIVVIGVAALVVAWWFLKKYKA
jgi:hypothetical protein